MKPLQPLEATKDDHAEEKESPEFLLSFNKVKKQPRAKNKRSQEAAEENSERWLVSYADFITLLFAFFVTMYSISTVDQQKLSTAAHSLQRALGSQSSGQMTVMLPDQSSFQTPTLSNPEIISENPERAFFEKLAEELQKEVRKVSDSGNQIQYLIHEGELIVRIPECLFFHSGDSSIRPEVIPILNALAKTLAKVQNPISIEGHTDNVPINTPRFGSNWELSTSRATQIIRYFLTNFKFDPDRLSAAGFAEFRPVAPNTTAEGRLKNRRVDLVILGGK